MSWAKAILTRRNRKRLPIRPGLLPDRPTPAIESLLYTHGMFEVAYSSIPGGQNQDWSGQKYSSNGQRNLPLFRNLRF